MSITISLLTLCAAFYELYLNRRHNEKSLRPLPQIVLGDHKGELFVQVKNNGVGPFIIDNITFSKDGQRTSNIEDFLMLDPKSYMHDILSADTVNKVIHPTSFLEVFNKRFDKTHSVTDMDLVRKALSEITLKVTGRDIYDNKITIERSFKWFSRHLENTYVAEDRNFNLKRSV